MESRRLVVLNASLLMAAAAVVRAGAEVTVQARPGGKDKQVLTFFQDGTKVAKAVVRASAGDKTLDVLEGEVPAGSVMEYHANGKLKAEWRYVAGQDGVRRLCRLRGYHASGKPDCLLAREGCSMEGRSYFYDKDGDPASIADFKNNMREGWTVIYFKDGKPKFETYFRADKRNGPVKAYRPGGLLFVEEQYKDDRKNGPSKVYHKDGRTLAAESNYVDDRLDGTAKTYYPSGKLESESVYEGGVLRAKTEYDETGAKRPRKP